MNNQMRHQKKNIKLNGEKFDIKSFEIDSDIEQQNWFATPVWQVETELPLGEVKTLVKMY